MSLRFSYKIFTLLVLCLCLNTTAEAQIKRANSPYSYFGIGDLEPTSFGMNKAMGGLSISVRSAVNINLDNPASLSAIQRSTFETGFDINGIGLSNGTATQSMSDMGISYLALAVPVTKFWGSSIGILPYSSVYYAIQEDYEIENIGRQFFDYSGVGSLYQFYWANGFSYKTVSAGFNMAYIFGNLNRSIRSIYPDQTNVLPYIIDEKSNIGGFSWNTGLQFHPKLSDRIVLTVGVTLGLESSLSEDFYSTTTRVSAANGVTPVDSLPLIEVNITDRKIDLPNKFGFGASVNKGSSWMAGFDVEMANWSETNLTDQNADYQNTFKVKAGAAFVPYREGLRNFINQTQFRIGAYYNNNYFDVRVAGTDQFQAVNQFGFTFGAGFPLTKRAASRLNVSFDVGQRGSIENDLLRETYFKANFGVSLNDLWFIKPKYD